MICLLGSPNKACEDWCRAYAKVTSSYFAPCLPELFHVCPFIVYSITLVIPLREKRRVVTLMNNLPLIKGRDFAPSKRGVSPPFTFKSPGNGLKIDSRACHNLLRMPARKIGSPRFNYCLRNTLTVWNMVRKRVRDRLKRLSHRLGGQGEECSFPG